MTDSILASWLARLERAHPRTIELGLERVARVRDAMALAPGFPVVLVGGTNGKGSTCAYVEAILRAQGYRTGLYTSPHLLRYNERIKLAGVAASDDAIAAGLQVVEAARHGVSLSYFEHGTLGAMWQFVEVEVDVAILEVGLGGRLDATNIFEPDVAAVTSIDLDHQAWLGNTREAIAHEKAGIFRAGKPAICGIENPPRTLTDDANAIGATLVQAGRHFSHARTGASWEFNWGGHILAGLPLPALEGDHQLRNAATALATLASLTPVLPVSLGAIHRGLSSVSLPGRFQRFQREGRGGAVEIVLDVAHNPEAARALAANLQAEPVRGRTHAVFAALADKDAENIVLALQDCVDAWYVAGLAGERGQSGATLARHVDSRHDTGIGVFADPSAAYAEASRRATGGDRIVVFGSFHTVAEILTTLS
jgi:dihydrofolate synthase/folylpolyglutamate synthase